MDFRSINTYSINEVARWAEVSQLLTHVQRVTIRFPLSIKYLPASNIELSEHSTDTTQQTAA